MGYVLKLDGDLWTRMTFAIGLSFRLLAIRYRWEMPKFVLCRHGPKLAPPRP